MKKDTILFIALDAHKKFHHAAYVEDGRGKEVIEYGQIKGSKIALTQFLKKCSPNIPTPHSISCARQVHADSGSIAILPVWGAAVTSFLRPGYPRHLEIVLRQIGVMQ